MLIWLVFEIEQWEDSSPVGIYDSEAQALARKSELEAIAALHAKHKYYNIWSMELNRPIRSIAEGYRDRHCLKTSNGMHIFLGKTCSVCDLTVED